VAVPLPGHAIQHRGATQGVGLAHEAGAHEEGGDRVDRVLVQTRGPAGLRRGQLERLEDADPHAIREVEQARLVRHLLDAGEGETCSSKK